MLTKMTNTWKILNAFDAFILWFKKIQETSEKKIWSTKWKMYFQSQYLPVKTSGTDSTYNHQHKI